MSNRLWPILAASLAALCCACAAAPRRAAPFVVNDEGDAASLAQALSRSGAYLQHPRRGRGSVEESAALARTFVDFAAALGRLGLSPALADYVRRGYDFYEQRRPQATVTGYFTPHLRGAHEPSHRFCCPLYRLPPDPGRFSRKEIDYGGRLAGQGLELVWVDDPIALYFLHIQGSGVIELEDGSTVTVQYAGDNGRAYRAIGGLLISEYGVPAAEISMQTIVRFLHEHPQEQRRILAHNPRYIFFREAAGVSGSLGVPLTPYRSVAIDPEYYPNGGLGVLVTELPVFDQQGRVQALRPFMRFVLFQDSGAAIKGPGRVDLYTGSGAEAALTAGHMRQTGKLYYLLKR